MSQAPGTLYIVATPIGNLEDITLRALRILRDEVDLIACEDTRQTRKLLAHYNIEKPLLSYHEHNERQRAPELLERLQQGQTIALVSDAGTPLISDPGYRLVSTAIAHGIPVVPIPGPSALLAALTASGLPTDRFHFEGFLPARRTQRLKRLRELASEHATLVFFEAPHRILACLEDLATVFPQARCVLARELTKIHEEFLRGTPSQLKDLLAQRPAIRGEFTVLIHPAAQKETPEPAPATPSEDQILDQLRQLLNKGMSLSQATRQLARQLGLPKRHLYRLAQKHLTSDHPSTTG